jgi:hypothetical protein
VGQHRATQERTSGRGQGIDGIEQHPVAEYNLGGSADEAAPDRMRLWKLS